MKLIITMSEEVESRSIRVDGRSEAYDRLNALITASSQKRSPMVPVRLKGKRNKESTKDIFSAPRTLGTVRRTEATAINPMMKDLEDSVKELMIAQKTMQAAIAEKDAKIDETVVKVEIRDQHSLREANEKLKAVREKKVKTRIAVDLSATGINGASPTPPFSYPGPQDGLQLVTRGCWLGKRIWKGIFIVSH
jgi:hypothetical protein